MVMIMNRKIFGYLAAGCLMATAATSCETMEEENWSHNNAIILDWTRANPEVGLVPEGLDSLSVMYFSKEQDGTGYKYRVPAQDILHASVGTGVYSLVVADDERFINRSKYYSTVGVLLPTEINGEYERVITVSPEEVLYVGMVEDLKTHYEAQQNVTVVMQRFTRQLDFTVVIGDSLELNAPLELELSGVACEKKIVTEGVDDLQSAILPFTLYKQGKHLNSEYCLTTYKGRVNIIGTVGSNILEIGYTDAAGVQRTRNVDLTPYFVTWDNGTVDIEIHVFNNSDELDLDVSGWGMGNQTDINI